MEVGVWDYVAEGLGDEDMEGGWRGHLVLRWPCGARWCCKILICYQKLLPVLHHSTVITPADWYILL